MYIFPQQYNPTLTLRKKIKKHVTKKKKKQPPDPLTNNQTHKSIPTDCYPFSNSTLPIKCSDHPLDRCITLQSLQLIVSNYQHPQTDDNLKITTIDGTIQPLVTHLSFHNLLTFSSMIDDSIFASYLQNLKLLHPEVSYLDTNFHCELTQHGW